MRTARYISTTSQGEVRPRFVWSRGWLSHTAEPSEQTGRGENFYISSVQCISPPLSVSLYVYTNKCLSLSIYICIHLFMYTHTYINTYTQNCVRLSQPLFTLKHSKQCTCLRSASSGRHSGSHDGRFPSCSRRGRTPQAHKAIPRGHVSETFPCTQRRAQIHVRCQISTWSFGSICSR